MTLMKIICIIILFLNINLIVYSQTQEDIGQINKIFEVSEHKHDHTSYIKKSGNELSFIFASLFWTYKEFISSQDINTCVFYPTCSVYAIRSIQEKGILTGILSTFDRLSRCHPFGKAHYTIHKETQKYYDPVE